MPDEMLDQTLDRILNAGRRRVVLDRLLSNLSIAGAAFVGGVILLLVLGTRIWDWWAPALLFVLVFAAGAIRAFLTRPSLSRVARMLDERCDLSDTLATAVHFRTSSLDVAVAQRRQAESEARKIDIPQSIPFQFPRSVYALAGLGVAASALFFYRVGTERQLTLAAPIGNINFDAFGLAARADDKARQERDRKVGQEKKQTPDNAMSRLGTSTPDNPGEKDSQGPSDTAVTSGQQASKKANDDPSGAGADGKKAGDSREEGSESSDAGASPPKQDGEHPPSTSDGSPQNAQSGNKAGGKPDSAGLMSKLRDAVSSLLAKMKPQGSQSPPGASQSAQQSTKPPAGQQGSSQQGKPEAKGNPSDQDGQESASAESDQMAPGKGAGKSSDQNASAKPGSGMGHQDGSKELKDAEQLNAMGKLSEIIGKRSANVTGEMTLEPQNGPQQLRTGYTNSTARHGEASGDVNRDEVPVALQGYVQQYFEQVRKQAAMKSKPVNN